MTTPAATEPTPTTGRSAAGGMRALTLATVFAAASGYLVMLVAGRALGPADYPLFATYWGAFFALGGVAGATLARSVQWLLRSLVIVATAAAVNLPWLPALIRQPSLGWGQAGLHGPGAAAGTWRGKTDASGLHGGDLAVGLARMLLQSVPMG